MKKNAKEKYQELLDYIEFPVMVYINETGKVIALNLYGIKVLGNRIQNMKEILSQDIMLRFRRTVLDVGRSLYYNLKVHTGMEMMELDFEINAIKVDNIHIVICFFEKSYKQVFVKSMSKQVPRLFFKNRNFQYERGSHFFLQDTKVDRESFLKNEDFLCGVHCESIKEEDCMILESSGSRFNMIYNGYWLGKNMYFIRFHRICVSNKDDIPIGILGIYTLILTRNEKKEIYDDTLRENYILNKVIACLNQYVLKIEMSPGYPIHYVSANFAYLDFIRYGLYNGTVMWQDLIHSNDYHAVSEKLHQFMETVDGEYPILRYRIRDNAGHYVYVQDETYSMEQHEGIWYRESVIKPKPELEK